MPDGSAQNDLGDRTEEKRMPTYLSLNGQFGIFNTMIQTATAVKH